jgi:hypothetical protein
LRLLKNCELLLKSSLKKGRVREKLGRPASEQAWELWDEISQATTLEEIAK